MRRRSAPKLTHCLLHLEPERIEGPGREWIDLPQSGLGAQPGELTLGELTRGGDRPGDGRLEVINTVEVAPVELCRCDV